MSTSSKGTGYRHVASGITLEVDRGKTLHLYAVWSDKPALFGYTMTIQTGDFTGGYESVNHGGYSLGTNGTTTRGGANKYVVLDGGHNYETEKSEPITITNATLTDTETDADKHYTFITWYNKSYNNPVGGHDSGNTNNNDKPFTFPGKIVYFGETNNIFSLDAMWARVEGQDKRVTWTEAGAAPDDVKLRVVAGDNIDLEALKKMDVTAVAKVGDDGAEEKITVDLEHAETVGKTDTAIGALVIPLTGLPEQTVVGAYDYHITVTFTSTDPNRGGEATVEGDVRLIIDPILTVKVKKTVKPEVGYESTELFAFDINEINESGGADLKKEELTLEAGEEGTAGTVTFDHDTLMAAPPYQKEFTFRVSETPGTTVGMTYASPQDVAVTVQGNANAHDTLTATVGGVEASPDKLKEDGNGNYELSLEFINTYETGTLKVKKVVVHETGAHADDSFEDVDFTFTVTADKTKNVDLSKAEVDLTNLRDGKVLSQTKDEITFTMKGGKDAYKDGKTVSISGLPQGVTYTVVEKPDSRYATSYSPSSAAGGSVTLSGESEITVTNYHYPGKLVIHKEVEDPYFGAAIDTLDTMFDFTVELTGVDEFDKDAVAIYDDGHNARTESGYFSIENKGEKSYTVTLNLKNGWQAVLSGLDENAHYVVTEESKPEYEDDYIIPEKAEGNITKADEGGGELATASVRLVNTLRTGTLSVTKNVVTPEGVTAPDRRFEMQLKFSGEKWTALKEHFTQEEVARLGHDATIDKGTDTITFYLRHNETFTMEKMPAGIEYELKETAAPGFTTKYAVNGGEEVETLSKEKIADGGQAVTVTNTYVSGALTISKELPNGGNTRKAFDIDVTLSGAGFTSAALTHTYTASLQNKSSARPGDITEVAFRSGRARIQLYGGESLVIQGLPNDITYNVQETGEAAELGYVVTYDDSQSGRISETGSKVTVTNTYPAGRLTVTKAVTGTAGEKNRDFTFTVTLDDDSVTGPRTADGKVVFTKGTATFTLKDSESVTIEGLLNGVHYTVTEDAVSGYKTTYEVDGVDAGGGPAAGTIETGMTDTVKVTNHRDATGGGGGGVSPPWTEPEPTATPSASPTPSGSPSPSPSAGPSPTPGGTPGPGQTSQPFYTPGPGGNGGSGGNGGNGTHGGTGGSGSGSGTGGPTSPATGDETAIAPWAVLLALSMAGLAAVLTIGRKRRR